MSEQLRTRIFRELETVRLIDPHTHIQPHSPAAKNYSEILGYHYYTELAHSAGLSREQIEDPALDPKEMVRLLVANLGPIQNTIQYSWLVELSQEFFGLPAGEEVTLDNWETLYDTAEKNMARPDWEQTVLDQSNLEAVFLTNDFDDALEGFDTSRYIPCLRADDLVFHIGKPEVRQRLQKATDVSVDGVAALRTAISKLFAHFTEKGCRACAISLPSNFAPKKFSPDDHASIGNAWDRLLSNRAGDEDRLTVGNFVFWTLAEHCAEYRLPFDLMIGADRVVYESGVFLGQDLFDSRVSLLQYRELLNAFPQVTFPISVVASVTNHELVSHAWIFPNVVTSGHWWYSNTPTYIEQDLSARLEAVPETKQIGYYSDMFKLEFALPKFRMFKRILAKVLAERFVQDRGWNEERALNLGKKVLRGNVEHVFPSR